MRLTWFLRMARWAHRPPSWERVVLVLGVIAASLLIGAFEWVFGWPDWLTVDQSPLKPPKLPAAQP
jgi:hypothetical protein